MCKFLSLLLALAMVLSFSAMAFASESDLTDSAALAGKTVILHSNDVHGAIDGYAYMAALKTKYEAMGAKVILVDAGDFSQGTPNVNLSKGLNAVALMNETGYDIVTIGNHDFDYGTARLKENLSQASFQVICANVFENGQPLYAPNYTYTTKSGLKLGFFGLDTPKTITKVVPTLVKGLAFLEGDEMFRCAQEQVIIDGVNAELGQVFARSEVELNGQKANPGNRDSRSYHRCEAAGSP